MRTSKHFILDEHAVTTVEFVAIFPFFIIIVWFVLEVALALFWWQSVAEAAQLGARLAVVWDPAVTGLPATNSGKNANSINGTSCSSNCSGYYSSVSLTGSACTSNTICARMASFFGVVSQGTVTITYASCSAPSSGSCSTTDLGFVGGPIVPYVTVTISDVPFDFIGVSILPNVGCTDGGNRVVCPMSVTLTGEDLSSTAGSS